MQLALPQLDTRELYQRLATVYTVVFAGAAISFYLTLLDSDVAVEPALFASIAAALHYSLLRIADQMPAQAPSLQNKRYKPTEFLADSDLVTRIGQLRQEAKGMHSELGLMLIELKDETNPLGVPRPEALKVVRGELFRGADSRIFQLDDNTLAIAECQRDVVLHFDMIALGLHRQLQNAQGVSPAASTRATVGVAVAAGGRTNAADLIDQARAAISLAEANGRDTFFRRVA